MALIPGTRLGPHAVTATEAFRAGAAGWPPSACSPGRGHVADSTGSAASSPRVAGPMRTVMSSPTEGQFGMPTDLGSRLRAAREAQQLSLREIADTTKISVSALEALEENDVARLPGGIFTRGFVRAYAAEVGLDPEQTIRDFMAQTPAEGIAEGTKGDDRSHEHELSESQQRMAGTVLGLVLVGVLVAALLFFSGTRGVPTGTGTPAAPATAVEPEPAPPPRLDPPIRAVPPTPIAPVPQPPLTIVLSPRGDCWVSLTIDGESVFRRVMHAGERETYEADHEIVMNIGDAGAFAFVINQREGRALGTSGQVVTARITLQNYRSYVVP